MTDQARSIGWRDAILPGIALACVLGTAIGAEAQALKDVQTPDTPLVLKAQGSFFVGGEKADQTDVELGSLGPAGHIAVNQMYVHFMVPQDGADNVPVVMVHGATLTGKSWETTPDGRMGWDEYFVRQGHPVYVPDQVGRCRSGLRPRRRAIPARQPGRQRARSLDGPRRCDRLAAHDRRIRAADRRSAGAWKAGHCQRVRRQPGLLPRVLGSSRRLRPRHAEGENGPVSGGDPLGLATP